MFEITLKNGHDNLVVKMSGELDFSRIEACLPVMNEVKLTLAKRYIVDLSDLATIDSSGLGMLISIRNSAMRAKGEFVIQGSHGQVADILKATRFDVLATMQ